MRQGRKGEDLSIEHPDTEGQITGKGDPEEVGELEQTGDGLDLIKQADHHDDEDPQEQEPEKGEGVLLQIEEKEAPEEVDDELDGVDGECGGTLWVVGLKDHSGTDPHEDIEDGPDDGEEGSRRGEGRFFHQSEGLDAVAGEEAGQGTHTQRDQDGDHIGLDF